MQERERDVKSILLPVGRRDRDGSPWRPYMIGFYLPIGSWRRSLEIVGDGRLLPYSKVVIGDLLRPSTSSFSLWEVNGVIITQEVVGGNCDSRR